MKKNLMLALLLSCTGLSSVSFAHNNVDPCMKKGWQEGNLSSVSMEDGRVLHIELNYSKYASLLVRPFCNSAKCNQLPEGYINKRVKVKLKEMTFGSNEGDGEWDGCGVTDIVYLPSEY